MINGLNFWSPHQGLTQMQDYILHNYLKSKFRVTLEAAVDMLYNRHHHEIQMFFCFGRLLDMIKTTVQEHHGSFQNLNFRRRFEDSKFFL